MAAGTVLARGLLLRTERQGGLVVRRAQPWCPPPLGRWLLRRLVRGGALFGVYLSLPPLRLTRRGSATVVTQRYLAGAVPLRHLTHADLADPRLAAALDTFWDAVERCWRETGRLPDIGGRVYLPWELYRPHCTDNVLVDLERRCWLVDPGATALFHCARWLPARLHAALMLRAVQRCRSALRRGAAPAAETAVL